MKPPHAAGHVDGAVFFKDPFVSSPSSDVWTTPGKSFKLIVMKLCRPGKAFIVRCLLAAILAGCSSVPADHEREAEFYYRMGGAAMSEGNLQAAYVQFQKGLQLDPYNKDILNSLGLVHFQLEEYDKAREYYVRALSADPAYSDAQNNLGVTYIKTGELQKAIECFKKALANPLYQTPERAFYNLGTSYYRLDQIAPSISAFKDSAKRAPQFQLPYYGLALAYNKAGRYGDAAEAIGKAIELDPVYRGNREKFIEDIRRKANAAAGDEKADLTSYLEIIHY